MQHYESHWVAKAELLSWLRCTSVRSRNMGFPPGHLADEPEKDQKMKALRAMVVVVAAAVVVAQKVCWNQTRSLGLLMPAGPAWNGWSSARGMCQSLPACRRTVPVPTRPSLAHLWEVVSWAASACPLCLANRVAQVGAGAQPLQTDNNAVEPGS